jgi:hypothetical protein
MHYATSRTVASTSFDEVVGVFHKSSPSRYTMALKLTQPLTHMNTRNVTGDKVSLLERKADNLTAICVPIARENV